MTSNHKRMLQGLLSLGVVLSAAEARAQKLETPGSPAAAAAPRPLRPGRLRRRRPARPLGRAPVRLQLGARVARQRDRQRQHLQPARESLRRRRLSLRLAAARIRRLRDQGDQRSAPPSLSPEPRSGTASRTSLEVAPRVGYGMMVGPWLGVWPRAGVTYVYSTEPILPRADDRPRGGDHLAPHLAHHLRPGRQHRPQWQAGATPTEVHHARRLVRPGDRVLSRGGSRFWTAASRGAVRPRPRLRAA